MTDRRKEVEAFADSMEERLRANDSKGGWKDATTTYLSKKLLEETTELLLSLDSQKIDDYDLIVCFIASLRRLRKTNTVLQNPTKEAADVGNISMMLADPERRERT